MWRSYLYTMLFLVLAGLALWFVWYALKHGVHGRFTYIPRRVRSR